MPSTLTTHIHRSAVAILVAILLAALAPTASADEAPRATACPPISPEAAALHRSLLLIDGHNDLPWKVRSKYQGDWRKVDIAQLQAKLQTDIPRLRAGNVGAQFWAAYVPAETDRTGTALRDTLDQIALIKQMIERWPDTFALALSADDIERLHKEGKIASLIGVEGGHAIQNSLAVLDQLYGLGVRYMTLTHSDTLAWADAATDDPRSGGLNEFGRDVVRRMNRLGMLVDISHVAPDTMFDALETSRAPIIASHSSARAVADHPRNVPDDVLKQLAKQGGVVMINFYSGFVVPESIESRREMFAVKRKLRAELQDEAKLEAAMNQWEREHPVIRGTLKNVVDHIDHVVRTVGIDHVGIGSDFDGVSMTPAGLDDVSCYPAITQELLSRGYSAGDIRKIAGENFLRVMRRAEAVAKELAAESPRGK
ncbi:MAG: dipeptidase [Planctomycetes bacterium]|nr:dipeptidase [Planctomycetota bacterium]